MAENNGNEDKEEKDRFASLKQHIRLLGDVLGETVKEQSGQDVFDAIEQVRTVAVAQRQGKAVSLANELAKLPDERLREVARAFAQFLNLVNIAEQDYREAEQTSVGMDAGEQGVGLDGVLSLLTRQGFSPETLLSTLHQLNIDLVLTAHPTEVMRRTLIRKYDRVADLLKENLPDAEKRERLRQVLAGIWSTDEIRRQQPTPVDEARWGFATIEQSLWQAVPRYLREIDRVLQQHFQVNLPVDAAPVRFSSWMGGDRDGNPNVTAEVTREVLLLSHWMAMDLYLRDVEVLREELSMHAASPALLQALEAAGIRDHYEPYRNYLKQIRQQLLNTQDWLEARLRGESLVVAREDLILEVADIQKPMQLLYQSLCECRLKRVADGTLLDVLRRIACFGVHLLRLDIRQDASRHSDVLAGITRYLGLGDYNQWDESQRQAFLLEELDNRRPLIDEAFERSEFCTDEIREVLATFRLLAHTHPDALGAYIISMARAASDVWAVQLLQKIAGIASPQRVVPLFETLDDLNHAGKTLESLLKNERYRESIRGHQEIMIGYSDSAKDAGFIAASWAQYQAQEQLVAVARRYQARLTLFHGRGGSVSRGGSPSYAAVLSQPPGAVNGSMRVTEQGEVIRFKFARPALAARHLLVYVSAVLEATLSPPPEPEAAWRSLMDKLAARSVQAYRQLVRETPAFIDYYRQVTPGQALTRLALGSRPSRRRKEGGIESLRAIPWVFAWTQNRLLLTAWLGVAEALEALSEEELARLSQMNREWPYAAAWLDMLAMVLSKTDTTVAQWYEDRLASDELKQLGRQLRETLEKTGHLVRQALQRDDLLEGRPLLAWATRWRNPYLDPLHLLQAELLYREREGLSDTLDYALKVCIAGIAAGMRNTG